MSGLRWRHGTTNQDVPSSVLVLSAVGHQSGPENLLADDDRLRQCLGWIPDHSRSHGNAWIDMAVQAGFPTLHTRPLYWVLYVVAVGTNVAGWIVLSLFTVFVLGLVF